MIIVINLVDQLIDDLKKLIIFSEMLRLCSKNSSNHRHCYSFLSGGVDSAVATAIMKNKLNFEVTPVYVKNWQRQENNNKNT